MAFERPSSDLTPRDLPWLLVLESLALFSLPAWDLTASDAAPVSHPVAFTLELLIGAGAAAILFHVVPALLAARFKQNTPRLFYVPAILLSVLYLTWLATVTGLLVDLLGNHPAVLWITPIAAALAVGWSNSLWKPVSAAALAIAAAALAYCLYMNPPHALEDSRQLQHLDGSFVLGILAAAAPVTTIAWTIGKLTPRPTAILRTALLGVAIPTVLSVGLAALATEAGVSVHWAATLPRGFYWALQNHMGIDSAALNIVGATLIGPAILGAFSLRRLVGARLNLLHAPQCAVPVLCALTYAAYLILRTLPIPHSSWTAAVSYLTYGAVLLTLAAAIYLIRR